MELTITQQFPPGEEPNRVEVVAVSSFGQITESVIVPIGEPAHLTDDSPHMVRWRYLWDDCVPGAWLGEGIVWQKPSD